MKRKKESSKILPPRGISSQGGWALGSSPGLKVSENGPYLVSGNLPLQKNYITSDETGEPTKWKKGKKYPDQANYRLCRCGKSKNKPYCDDTHLNTKFNGKEVASRKKYLNQAEKTTGPTLDLFDVPDLCANARFCHPQGGTWTLTEQSDNPKSKKTAIQQSCDCPSGRLVAYNKKTKKPIEPKFEQSIDLVEDTDRGVSGPIWVKGEIPLQSSDDSQYEIRNRMTLCRCGKSQNKPFCDGSHIPSGFSDGDKSLK